MGLGDSLPIMLTSCIKCHLSPYSHGTRRQFAYYVDIMYQVSPYRNSKLFPRKQKTIIYLTASTQKENKEKTKFYVFIFHTKSWTVIQDKTQNTIYSSE